MNAHDIIEVATPHTCNGLSNAANALFRDTFDPEHVALMEAVCEAVTLTVTPNTGAVVVRVDPHAIDAVAALVAYRKERGL